MNQSIIIIDDEKDICFLLGNILRKDQYQVQFAHSLKEGEQLLQHQTPYLIFLDIHLPDGSGMDKLPQIRERYPQTKIIMISAFDTFKERQSSISNGADAFIPKPFTKSEVQTVLKQLTHD